MRHQHAALLLLSLPALGISFPSMVLLHLLVTSCSHLHLLYFVVKLLRKQNYLKHLCYIVNCKIFRNRHQTKESFASDP